MKKIIIEVPEMYGDIISATVIGGCGTMTINVSTSSHALKDGTRFIVPETGKWIQLKDGDLQ